MDNLVSTAWLAAELGKPGLLVFDTTKYLPNEPHDGRAKYAEAHIPGAGYFDIDEVPPATHPARASRPSRRRWTGVPRLLY